MPHAFEVISLDLFQTLVDNDSRIEYVWKPILGDGYTHKTCIVSDADEDMVPGFYQEYGIMLFTSENYQSYKNDEHNKMFKELLRINGVDPSKVLHIGDSVNDVLGAKREGMKACWLNRRGLNWEWDVEPDYEVRSLLELNPILMKG